MKLLRLFDYLLLHFRETIRQNKYLYFLSDQMVVKEFRSSLTFVQMSTKDEVTRQINSTFLMDFIVLHGKHGSISVRPEKWMVCGFVKGNLKIKLKEPNERPKEGTH